MLFSHAFAGFYYTSGPGAAGADIGFLAERVNVIARNFPSQCRIGYPKTPILHESLPSWAASTAITASD